MALGPLFALAALGVTGLVLAASSGTASAKTPAPPGKLPITPGPGEAPIGLPETVTGISGTKWKVQVVAQQGGKTLMDVFIPAGEKGPHQEFRVLRFSQTGSDPRSRVLVAMPPGVDQNIFQLAISDFSVKTVDASSPGFVPTPDLPLDLKNEMARAIQLLTVDPVTGIVIGPVTPEAVRIATEVASKLETAGFPEAAKTMRDLASAAAKRVPSPPIDKQVPLPGLPAVLQDQVNRALQLERDPAKLRAIAEALKKLPASPERDTAVNMLEALILQVEARKAEDEALRKVEEVIRSPNPPSASTTVPASSSPRKVAVLRGEGPWHIAQRLTGNGNRFPELVSANIPRDAGGRARKRAKDGNLTPAINPGEWLFVPAKWPAHPQALPLTAPGNLPPPPPPNVLSSPGLPQPLLTSTAPAGPSARIVVVLKGEGPWQIAQRLTGNGGNFPQLVKRNIPVDAEGRKRSKAKDGGFVPGLQPGQRLFVPENWPVTPQAVAAGTSFSGVNEVTAAIGAATEVLRETRLQTEETLARIGVEPSPKSALEMAAEAMCSHLHRLQNKRPGNLGRGREDRAKVSRFQHLAGIEVDGRVTPETLVRAAEVGQSKLPLVMYWPDDATAESVFGYRNRLLQLAEKVTNNAPRAAALFESAMRETGQGGIQGEMPE